MRDKWNPGPSKGRNFIDKLRADGIVSKWDEKHNRPVRDGTTWVEREVDKIPKADYEGLRREQVIRRLEAYIKQGMKQPDALPAIAKNSSARTRLQALLGVWWGCQPYALEVL